MKKNSDNIKKTEKNAVSIRSSAAEYLTFVAATGDNAESVEMRYEDENIWITQKMLAALYNVEVNTINYHIKKIFDDNELIESSVIRNFRITAGDGKTYDTKHYNLQMTIAVGFKVNSERAVQFRKWVNKIAKDYTIQGWVMDSDRLKSGGSVLTEEYFERQLQKIREIRMSERKFYQKITDIYATALDYDKSSKATQRFYATVQNKLHWAIHGNTAAELIYNRANAKEPNMGLTTWQDAPDGKIIKADVSIAKNYLAEDELASLSRIVNAYLDIAEDMAKRKLPMTMEDWEKRLGIFLQAANREVLQDAGSITHEIARAHAESEFEKYRIVQDRLYRSDFDRLIEETQADKMGDMDHGI
ncbi:toxin Fic [Spirochaetia bacterium]|nr:toxin Fic [Spirochaetia bacterium]